MVAKLCSLWSSVLLLTIHFIILIQTLNCTNYKYKFIEGGLSKADKEFILKKHNDFRKLIANGKVANQPKGTNLKIMKWDNKLAEQAQNIADTCIYKHALVNETRWPVGQNLYRKRSTSEPNTNWNRAIQTWFDEHEKYLYSNSTAKRVKGTGHYTQMIWATTEYLGCGYSYFETKEAMKYQKLYICNYGPRGNIRGVLPYEKGERGCENLC